MQDNQTPVMPEIPTYPPGTIEYAKFVQHDIEHNTLQFEAFTRVVNQEGRVTLQQCTYSRNFSKDQKAEFLAECAKYKASTAPNAPMFDGQAYCTMAGW